MGIFSKKAKQGGNFLALQFGTDGICAASVRRVTDAKPLVENCAFFPADKLTPLEQLVKVGKELHAKRHACLCLLNQGQYQLLTVEAPNVPAAEVKLAVRWKLKEMLDFPLEEATIDVLDIPPDKGAPTRSHNMFAVAARGQTIAPLQGMFTAAKLPLQVIDIPDTAQRNLSALAEPEGRGVALLSFGQDGGLLTVTFGGELYLSRRVDLTFAQLQDTDPGRRAANHDKVTLELQRSLDNFDRHFNFITLSKLMLCPMGAAAEGLHEHLAANLYTKVELLALDSVLDISKADILQDPLMQQRFFLVLGAALRAGEGAP